MLTAYPETSSGCSDEYLATLAQTLCQFPMEVATKACSPVHGVPKEQKNFRPTAGQIHEWCEREAAWLYRMAEREGLLRGDSHKTYCGTLVTHNQKVSTAEERRAHVERLRKEGRLTFDTGPEAERRKSFFDRLTKAEAEKFLADNFQVVLDPAMPTDRVDIVSAGQRVSIVNIDNDLAPVPF